jgi:parvulin-like peptidyl-prolyl isomerase
LMIRKLSQREEIPAVTDAELQAGVDEVREALGLYSASATESWLAVNAMTLDDFERGVETNLLADRWAEKMVGGRVDSHFAEHRGDFDEVALSQILVADESIARELKEQIDEGEADFAILARAYSFDDSAEIGGYLGRVQRATLSRDIQAAVFSASENSVVGPIRSGQGYHLLYVRDFKTAELTSNLRRQIRTSLMEPVLEAERKKVQVQVLA